MASKSEYENFLEVYRAAHPDVNAQKRRLDGNEAWKKAKKDGRIPEVLAELKLQTRKRKSTQDSFWTAKKPAPQREEPEAAPTPVSQSTDPSTSAGSDDKSESQPDHEATVKPTPAQTKCTERIGEIKAQLNRLLLLRDANMCTSDERQKIKALRKELDSEESRLKKLQREAKRQRDRRGQLTDTLKTASQEYPDLRQKLKSFTREEKGRPRVEVDQDGLKNCILSIVSHGASADSRRRTEQMESAVTSLDQLHAEVQKAGYKISRSALYCRILPRCSNTNEGKRHVHTVPVKLLRAQNDARKHHIASNLAYTTVQHVKEAGAMIGSGSCAFLSLMIKRVFPSV